MNQKDGKSISYDWIAKTIDSCTTKFHIDGCVALIELFFQKYKDDSTSSDLFQKLENKENQLFTIG